MKKKTSKLLSLMLSLALCLSLVPTVAFAAEQPTEGPVEVTEMGPPVLVPDESEEETSSPVSAPPSEVTDVVAKIEDTAYQSIQAAINAAESGSTIVVQDDVKYSDSAPLNVASNKTIILELNGHTISQSVKETQNSALLTNMGTLTIQDSTGSGKLTAHAENPDGQPFKYGNYTIDNHGTLIVSSGTVENTTKAASNAAGAATYAVNSISDKGEVSVTLNGGKLIHSGNGNSIRQMARSAEHENNLIVNGNATLSGGIFQQLAPSGDAAAKATLTMNGGELSGYYAINQNSTNGKFDNAHITVASGTVHGAISINWPFSGNASVNAGHVSITGGSFDKQGFDSLDSIFDIYESITSEMKFITGGTYVENPSAYVPATHEATESDGTWTVSPATSGNIDTNQGSDGNTEITGAPSDENVAAGKVEVQIQNGNATVNQNTAKALANSSVDLTVNSETASVTIPAEAMKAVSSDVKVLVQKANITGTSAAVEVKVTANNKNLLPNDGVQKGTVTISIPTTLTEGHVYYVTGSDDSLVYAKEMDAIFADGKVTFTTNHLSKYAVTEQEQVTAEAQYFAKAGEEYTYGTLTDALSKADNSTVITLLKNIAVNSNSGYTVANGKTLTLELNGHTITQTVSENNASALFTNLGILTIQDSSSPMAGGLVAHIGNHASGTWSYGNYLIDNQGTITLNCNISNTLGKPYGAAIALNNVPNSSMTINGGKIETASTAIRLYAKDNNKNVALTINGGEIISRDPIWVQAQTGTAPAAKVTVTGGEIRSTGEGSNGPTTIRTTHMGETTGLNGIAITVSGGKLTGGNIDLGAAWNDEKTATGEKLTITGGEIDGIYIHTEESTAKHEDEVTGGIFKTALPTGMIKDNSAVATVSGSNGTVTAVGNNSIQQAAKQNDVTQITVTQGNVTLGKDDVPAGVVVKNDGTGTVQVGDQTISQGQSLMPNPIKPDGGSSGGGGGGGSSSTSSYEIVTHNDSHGTVSVMPSRASKGDRVTITVNPDNGYVVDKVIVTDHRGDTIPVTDKGNGKFTFTMPSGKVSIKATFRAEQQNLVNPFYDVDSNAYYYAAVGWAAQNGITGGTSATTFSPNAHCTRAQIVTFLWRAAGSPAPYGSQKAFKDVPADSYYSTAVLWAVENGITSGTSDTTFSPDLVCTRAQAVTFLHRSQNAPAVGSGAAFGDVASDAYYASAVSWAAQNGITGGTGANTFSPDASCTRAQIVTFLYRTFVK